MLTVTERAATAIDGILSSRDLPDEAGVRVTTEFKPSGDGTAPGPEIQMQIVEAPQDGDQVIEQASLYVEPEAANLLDGKTLDAEQSGDTVRFALTDQAA
jgi:Fe-S cluster assembly iron-binding protein IscA